VIDAGPARAIGDLGGRLERQNSMGRQNNAMEKIKATFQNIFIPKLAISHLATFNC
jgi:hypothetical protein